MVDEAYFEFSRSTMRPLLEEHENLVILRTFSKAFSLAGVRLGYLLANESVIREFIKVRQPYSVDALSQVIGCAVFRNRAQFEPGINQIIEQRGVLIEKMRAIPGIEVFDSDSNYILIRLANAAQVWQQLYERGILVRDFSKAPLLENCLRISVGLPEENEALLTALEELVSA